MKKILQDLSFEELENLILSLGEKKFRAKQLYEGLLTLQSSGPALIDGITQLRDGAMQLSDGLKEFDEKGIQKLVDAVDGDMESLFTRLRATADVSKDYNSFSGLSDDMAGQVKFIYRTEAVKTK